MKERITYTEKYRPGSMPVKEHLLPDRMPYMAERFKVVRMEVRAAGTVERDGEELEYQDVRIYAREEA